MSTLDLETIQKLLGEQKKKDDEKHVPGTDKWYKHGFEKRMRYLFELPYDRMFQPANIHNHDFLKCIGCGRLVKDPESHYNWHKEELSEKA